MADDIYVQAYRQGGVEAVSALLKKQFPDDGARVRATEDLEETGLWGILWHKSSRTGRRDLGVVMEFFGDE
ncbi:MAG: hypothetical protein EOS54_04525 [Mesorhizobium sp.]|uniref:hypothetical protein n=1 Tax=unclassified Mesorhizobium TaxID=325217 RepID=UPI000F76598B|nr:MULTISPECIES: hypothetical protein [unclassified Mesorhizobium]AZO47113.1 hypothetical protein EJ073_04200 [Mesorhizobium sp. M4B.F.Ca.ET.058.02.1.1]RWC57766.1 MAG: hypothetical protein EOS54_04525 [Mesorhizobium sp.]RWD13847.1 MAG: hypothetical protein EOS74_17780 [Mesorhizobium sp.]RWD55561.1 MAG: hypothetical protein EOS75_16505 [Mesorhizobium sp.]TIU72339.1 MAG: hypothetical protein E5W25_00980 [Mesorhizobium sp.]